MSSRGDTGTGLGPVSDSEAPTLRAAAPVVGRIFFVVPIMLGAERRAHVPLMISAILANPTRSFTRVAACWTLAGA